jgi:hypothetical protein
MHLEKLQPTCPTDLQPQPLDLLHANQGKVVVLDRLTQTKRPAMLVFCFSHV